MLARSDFGLPRLLLELGDPARLVHRQDPHPARLGERDAADGDRHVGPALAVEGDEGRVVHLVDVVAGQDQDDVAGRLVHHRHVLEDGVRRAAVPLARSCPARCTAAGCGSRPGSGPGPTARPEPMWSESERGLYWVRTATLSMSELTQFDRAKSMIRNLPPKGTAGLARFSDRIERRAPSPPARITARVRFIGLPHARGLEVGRGRSAVRCYHAAPGRSRRASDEEARVDEVVVEDHRPVEVRARSTGRSSRRRRSPAPRPPCRPPRRPAALTALSTWAYQVWSDSLWAMITIQAFG